MKTPTYLSLLIIVALLFSCSNPKSESEKVEDEVREEAEEAMDEISEAMGGDPGSVSVLSNADIDRYLETIEPMSKEFEALGKNFNRGMEDPDDLSLKELFDSDEVRKVAEKYGWDEELGPKMMAITMGISYLVMEDQVNNLPEEQKGPYKEMIATQWEQYRSMIHDDDLELLRPRLQEIMVKMRSMSDSEG